ncbi:PREDICTED: uncharacterized protein LOC108368379 [Rhagoletis zephyria]|uniref:uncharacterized protein LOC108368379 n=1 Tax=Rhagoletis zephyria TaxID=28612 RepID=UPI000811A5DC|nr:PREDICTED: uncharacterized protein LOC108368379 [Rhagoletis zephyria]
MRELAGDKLLKSLWLKRLPDNVRAVISIGTGNSTDMARKADQMMEMLNFSNVSAIRGEPTLGKQIQQLQAQIDELKVSRAPRNQSRGTKTRDKSQSRPRFPFCKYHWRFGVKAKKCVEPCQFKKLDMTEN